MQHLRGRVRGQSLPNMALQRSIKNKHRINVVFIGDKDVGKTSLFELFRSHKVCEMTQSTVGLNVQIINMVPRQRNVTVELIIHDTAGEERFKSIMQSYFRDADIALLVYDITDGNSFQNVRNEWKKDVIEGSNNEDICMILVGNKTDKGDQRIVESCDVATYARANRMRFIEVSAMNPDDYDLLYGEILRAVEEVLDKGGSFVYRNIQPGANIRLHEPQPQAGHQQQEPQEGRQQQEPQEGRQQQEPQEGRQQQEPQEGRQQQEPQEGRQQQEPQAKSRCSC
ncbi:PREDICTED: GTP-binding protein ryh1-like [Amphimedon queenslandica]|uniref:Uncharacterized protein n=1 Tax=Amphimedon queenslandica TaxID=400682 RepID=A0A1X7VMW7_AMPQE|nr:PREDICTED: GTP-binding protein ryh1-like [Amphimedon queenslandica]|eukprot:XP_011409712.2 PREDICTED: GTP-binding protein ryh1-like [Amphimedon queenslandica]